MFLPFGFEIRVSFLGVILGVEVLVIFCCNESLPLHACTATINILKISFY